MRCLLIALFITALVGTAWSGDPGAPFTGRVTDKSRICMMQDSVQPKTGLAHAYQGQTYWLCCAMCEQAFNGDPERYARAKDPVTGTMVDKASAPVYAVNGRAYFFSSEDSLAKFAKEPARYLSGS